MISSADKIRSLKERVSVEAVALALGLEVIKGRMRCPRPENHAHGDRTPSVSINAQRGTFRCWVCPDVHGDAIELVRLVQGVSFPQALQFLESLAGGSPPHTSSAHPAPKAPAAPTFLPPSREIPRPAAPRRDTREILVDFLKRLSPVEGAPARWLTKRRIFQSTWVRMKLRWIPDYDALGKALLEQWGREALIEAGLFNEAGHLRYYKHRLILPYLDPENRLVYFQARTIEPGVLPKELNLRGGVPVPFNAPLLDGKPGLIYMCEGVMDALSLLERKFPAVGIPGAGAFKPEWASLFRNKQVYLAFDNDTAGQAGQARVLQILQAAGVETYVMAYEGSDINAQFLDK